MLIFFFFKSFIRLWLNYENKKCQELKPVSCCHIGYVFTFFETRKQFEFFFNGQWVNNGFTKLELLDWISIINSIFRIICAYTYRYFYTRNPIENSRSVYCNINIIPTSCFMLLQTRTNLFTVYHTDVYVTELNVYLYIH